MLRPSRRGKANPRRLQGRLRKVGDREIGAAAHDVRIDLLRHGLTEESAFAVEAAAIDLLGMSDLANRVVGSGTLQVGRMSVADVTAAYGAQPCEIAPECR